MNLVLKVRRKRYSQPDPSISVRSEECLKRCIEDYDFVYAWDVGSGNGFHSSIMGRHGIESVKIDQTPNSDVVGKFPCSDELYLLKKPDLIWSSHCLEHQRNPGAFLDAAYFFLDDDGYLAITVPPMKHSIVGGHVTLWTEGLLIYNLILAGFDCSKARVGVYDYNISVIVQKPKEKIDLSKITGGRGDIEILSEYFPFNVSHGFDGRFGNINW